MNTDSVTAGCWPANNDSLCAKSQRAAEDFEYTIVTVHGGYVIERDWLGSNKPHHVRCVNGHDCYPRPSQIQRGFGPCRTCAGLDPIQAEKDYRETLIRGGHAPLWGAWLGVHEPHHVRCVNGHDCYPRPNNVRGVNGPCRACAGKDPVQAEKDCKAALIRGGHTPLWGAWLGANKPHHVRCVNGHDCYPHPNSVREGRGPCAQCACQLANVFYIVAQPLTGRIKFGITSNDARQRLSVHAATGHTEILFLREGLPIGRGREVESLILDALKTAGYLPWQGREYYESDARDLAIQLAQQHLEMPTTAVSPLTELIKLHSTNWNE